MPIHLPFGHELLRLVEQHQYLALFILILLEESGIPLPVPGDGLMVFAGYMAFRGNLNFFIAFGAMEAGTLIGASILRWIGRWGGRPLVHRYGHLIHLNQKRLDQAERWLTEHGPFALIAGRLIPGLRLATSVISGIFDIPYHIFLPFVGIGSAIYILFFMFVGFGLGREGRRLVRAFVPHPALLVLVVVALLVIAGLIVWLREREQQR